VKSSNPVVDLRKPKFSFSVTMHKRNAAMTKVNTEFGLKKVRRFPPELEGAAEQTEIRTRQIPQPAAPPSFQTQLAAQLQNVAANSVQVEGTL